MGSELIVPVSHAATPVLGGTPSRGIPEYWNGSIRWATAKDVAGAGGRYLYQTGEFISSEGLNKSPAKILPEGTIVITARGTVGALVQLGESMAFNQTCYGLRPKEGVNQNYLYYALKNSLHQMHSLTYGTVFDTITMKTFDQWTIPLPPLPLQNAISGVLGALDDKIELNQQMNQTLEEMAQTIFKSWFVDFDPVRYKAAGQDPPGLAHNIADLFPDSFEDTELGEIPAKWFIQTLGDITGKPQYGFTASGNHVEVGPRMLRITDINREPWINWSSVPYCEIDAQSFSKNRLHHGDLVIARTGATTGENAFIEDPPDAVFASYLIRFRPKDQRYGRYLQYWMRSNAYDSLVKARQAGSTRESLNAQVIAGFPILIPPSLVAEAFGDLVESLRMKLNHNNRQTRTLSELRDTLLPKLISGEFRIPDAERIVGRCM